MNQNLTWIKLYRKLLDWEWYSDVNTKAVFLHLLLIANTEDKKWKGIEVKKGSLITSIFHLSKSLGLSAQNTRTSLEHLKSTNEVTIKTTPQYTLIKVNNFNDYQQVTNKLTNDQQTTNKQLTTTKEYKNKELRKNTIESIGEDDIKEIAIKYQVSVSFVSRVLEELVLYCGSTGKKYADYKMTLMAWVRRKTEEKPHLKLKELRPDQIEDIRKNDKLLVYKKAGYDTSVLSNK